MEEMMPKETIYVKNIYQEKIDQDGFNLFNFDTELECCFPLEIDNDDMEFNKNNISNMIREIFGKFPEVGKHDLTEQPFLANTIKLDWFESPDGPEQYQKAMRNWYIGACQGDEPSKQTMTWVMVDKGIKDDHGEVS